MQPTASELTREIRERGFVVIPRLLSSSEAKDYRAKMLREANAEEASFDPKRRWLLGDGPNIRRDWWPLIVHPRILDALHTVIGPDVCYLRNADLQVQNDRRIWHRDSPCREFAGADFDESRYPYQVFRVGLYFHTFAESGSKLGLIPGSHRHEPRIFQHEWAFWDRVRSVLGMQYILPPFLSVRPIWVKLDFGDCIIFDARVLHAPSRFHGPKLAAYLSYGANNEHSRNFYKHYVYDRRDMNYGPLDPELRKLLASKNLLLPEDQAPQSARGLSRAAAS